MAQKVLTLSAGGVVTEITDAKQDALSGTGFVVSTAGTISYDTNTYLTTSSASSTYAALAGSPAFTGTMQSNSTYGCAIGAVAGKRRIQYGSDIAGYFTFLTDANGYAGLYALSIVTPPVAFASLPAGVTGMRAFVNNNSAGAAFGSAANGSGAVTYPVYHDGVSWKVG